MNRHFAPLCCVVLAAFAATSAFTAAPKIVGGSDYSLALKADGTVWGWGRNSSFRVLELGTSAQWLETVAQHGY